VAERTYSVTEDMHVLWITAGLGCDGDTVALTAATQPSLEDLIFGTIPGVPKMKLHNPVLAYGVGNEFLNAFMPRPEANWNLSSWLSKDQFPMSK
jgi:Ni,Fe-hydrogenase I small subunit